MMSSTQCNSLQHSAEYTTTHTATHCNALQHTATHCNTMPHTIRWAGGLPNKDPRTVVMRCRAHNATRYNTPQHAALQSNTHCNKHCNALDKTLARLTLFGHAIYTVVSCSIVCNTPQHITAHHSTLEHAATCCNTPLELKVMGATVTCSPLRLHPTTAHHSTSQHIAPHCTQLHPTATHCNTLQHIVLTFFDHMISSVCCSVLQCAAVCCSVLQCVAVCCSV